MRLLIFGGRNFNEPEVMHFAFAAFIKLHGMPSVIIHGDAPGADRWGKYYAINVLKIPHRPFPAKWRVLDAPGAKIRYDTHGRAYNVKAGMVRNTEMLEIGKPDWGMGFKGGAGTAHMAKVLTKAGIQIWDAGYGG